MELLGTRPFFWYVWISELTHDDINLAGYYDIPIRDLLRRFNDRGTLNRTIVVFLSDHGGRLWNFRTTPLGWYEDRLPYALLLFPRWFLRDHPDLAASMKRNQKKLSTPYDMHATLLQLASAKFTETVTRYGRSLLHTLPENRTCESASIPEQFCSCDSWKPFPLRNSISKTIALFVIAQINTVLNASLQGKCLTWTLRNIEGVRTLPRKSDHPEKQINL